MTSTTPTVLFPLLSIAGLDTRTGYSNNTVNNSSARSLLASLEEVTEVTKSLAENAKNMQEYLKDKPKRPLSAYNLFFRMERDRLLNNEPADEDGNLITPEAVAQISVMRRYSDGKKRQHRKTHGKIGFNELTRIISEKWKTLPETTKELFEERAVVEKTKYIQEIKQWKNSAKHKKHLAAKEDACLSTPVKTKPSKKNEMAARRVSMGLSTSGSETPTVTPTPSKFQYGKANVNMSSGSLPMLGGQDYYGSQTMMDMNDPVVISDVSESSHGDNPYYVDDDANMIMNNGMTDEYGNQYVDGSSPMMMMSNPGMMLPDGIIIPPFSMNNNRATNRFKSKKFHRFGKSNKMMRNMGDMYLNSYSSAGRRHSFAGMSSGMMGGFDPMLGSMSATNLDYDSMYDYNVQPFLLNALDDCEEAYMMAENTLGQNGMIGTDAVTGHDDYNHPCDTMDGEEPYVDEYGNTNMMFNNMDFSGMNGMIQIPPMPLAAMMTPSSLDNNLLRKSRKRRHSTTGVFERPGNMLMTGQQPLDNADSMLPNFIEVNDPKLNEGNSSSSNNLIVANNNDEAKLDCSERSAKKQKQSRRPDLSNDEQVSQSIFNEV